ncbi:FAD-dependent monooxygenase [Streptantibioticus cattleyicolor]|uniref:Polyketide hydroxylase n=1 Tax=Streptantibioticus cattleyicolor (strain ATCC 35852 / DSM 46488 / JCM 4925 / NBRC 14057 / NRRL 8057) TaxID=1003195 RepID=F8JJW3_STREN|nr:FAD-dependent monooxygenase [Streptantibioticus cattleyicolor]AEW98609.1 polyketide hydroxylase [Streptantibioticus cattleyicolor NRRL 8057 = DSM 46488]CCB72332.1 putative oxidase [Streptantibioticus cattleyicolor NRRL 8057 = DSM 46488]
MSHVPVVIAGGGTVGLATAVFLGHHGVPSLVVERRPAPSEHPRALGISPRTLEFFHEVGLGREMAAAAVRSAELWRAEARTVAEIDRTPAPSGRAAPPAASAVSPEVPHGHYPQNRIDAVLLPAARERGATVEFGVAVTDVAQDADAVTVTLSDGRVVTADHLIGADGIRGTVRDALGVTTTGPGEIGDVTMNILFDADLVGAFGTMPVMTRITHPDAPGILLAVGERRWVLHVVFPEPEPSPERCARAVRTAIGADIPVEVVSVLPWRAIVRMADTFRRGRAFLVGDAARAVSPLGAFGLNTGLADAHNLAWKLAMVHSGQAGDRLLDSYHDERHAVAQLVTRQALLRWHDPRLHWDPAAVAERRAVGAWNASVVVMGHRYASSAVIDPVVRVPSTEDVEACFDAAPGSRVPHRVLGGADVSTVYLPRSRFAVLTGPAGDDWCAAAGRTAAALGTEVRAVKLDAPTAASMGLQPDGVLLLRPDAFIAWRSRGPADTARLTEVLAAVTGRG